MPLVSSINQKGEDTLLRVKVQPKASCEAIRMGSDGLVKIAVTAPAVDNAANKAVISFLAKLLKKSKQSVVLASGEHCREKSFLIRNISESEVLRILEIHVKNG